MLYSSTNDSLRSAVRNAAQALGMDKTPNQCIVIIPNAEGRFTIRWVKVPNEDYRQMPIMAEITIAADVSAIVSLSGTSPHTETLVFINEADADGPCARRRWTLLDTLTLQPRTVDGLHVGIDYPALVID
jgi:hypothetical protein